MRKQLRKWGVGIATAAVLLSGAGAVGLPAWETVVAEAASYTIEDGVLKEYYGSGGAVDLPSTVKSIGNDAFAGSSITSIVIPSTVTSIGDRAFQDCVNLRSITMPLTTSYTASTFDGIPDGYTVTFTEGTEPVKSAKNPGKAYGGRWVTDYAKKVVFAEGVTIIPAGIARDCSKYLTTIVIPSTCTEIGNEAFKNCTYLTGDIVLPEKLATVGEYAFYKTGIHSVTVKNPAITLKLYAFSGSKIVSFDDFTNIKSMGSNVFEDCLSLTGEVSFNDDLDYIPKNAFMNTAITKVTIPENMASIDDRAFNHCLQLTDITLPLSTGYSNLAFDDIPERYTVTYTVGDGTVTKAKHPGTPYFGVRVVDRAQKIIFSEGISVIPAGIADGCSKYLTEIVIPSTCTEIGDNAFKNCTSLRGDFVMPKKFTKMGSYAFYNTGINSVTLTSELVTLGGYVFAESKIATFDDYQKIKSLGEHAFENCVLLADEVSFYDDLDYIPKNAFMNTAITKVTIPENMASIDDRAFNHCLQLTDITLPLSAGYSNLAFDEIPEKYTVTYTAGDGTVTNAKHPGTPYFGVRVVDRAKKIIFSEGITVIPAGIADGCSKYLTEIVVPSTCTEIGNNAFKGCTALVGDMVFPEKMTKVGNYAFYNTGITSATLESNTVTLGSYAFSGSKITKFVDYKKIKSMGEYAFADCTALTGKVSFQDDLYFIPHSAFRNTGITWVTFPEKMELIAEFAFADCEALMDIEIPLTAEYKAYTFDNIPEGYTVTYTAGTEAVKTAKHPGTAYGGRRVVDGAERIIFAEGITIIPAGIARGCGKYLRDVILPQSCTEIGNEAFRECTNLSCPIDLSETVAKVGEYAFYKTAIRSASVKNSAASLEAYAFSGTKITSFKGYENIKYLSAGVFMDCTSLTGEVIFRAGRENVANDAFRNTAITKVTFPETLISIGDRAFQDCINLVDITMPLSTSYSSSSFGGLPEGFTLTYTKGDGTVTKAKHPGTAYGGCRVVDYAGKIIFADGITVIPDGIANGCSRYLSEIILPSGCKTIGQEAFKNCVAWDGDTFIVPATLGSIGSNAFTGSGVKDMYYYDTKDNWNTKFSSAQRTFPSDLTVHYMVIDPYVAPTCTTVGWTEGDHCVDCGEALNPKEEIPALGHKSVVDKAVAPTCTETGLTEGTHCSVCEEILIKQEVVEALGHKVVTDKAVPATCTETGLTKGTHCSRCKVVLTAQKEVPAKGHTKVDDPRVEPTCTETGLTAGVHCSACGEVFVAQESIPALGHKSVTDKSVAPTCTKTGLTSGTHCSVCSTVLKAQTVVAAKGHTVVTDAGVAPTCTETGLTEGSHCSVCKAVLVAQEEIPATGHTKVTDRAVAATCTKAGLTKGYHCSVCKEVLTAQQVVPALGHDVVVDEAIAVGCETDGLTEGSHCARCATVLVFQDTIPATGHHSVLAPRVEPTCTEVGWTAGSYCEYCGEVYIVQTKIAAKGHKTVKDAAVAATCTKAGLTAGTHCSVCNEVLKAQEVVEALGHNYVAVVTKPVTYSAAGEKVYTCSVCKHSYKETLPRLDLPFTDVKLGSWHESTVRFMLDNKLMSGKTATTFEPSTIMNRGQLVTILWNMEGKPKVTGTMNFTDVTTKSTFYTAILWASQNKIVNGYSNGEFRPKGELTREQIATILMNYTKFKKVPIANQADLSSFKDVASVNNSMLAAMKWAVGNKIISGKSGGTLLDPKGMASRIEVAAMVMNYCKNIAK